MNSAMLQYLWWGHGCVNATPFNAHKHSLFGIDTDLLTMSNNLFCTYLAMYINKDHDGIMSKPGF